MSTTPQQPIVRNKSTLAKLLASENITILHEKIPTAMFNLKSRTLFLPMWETASNSTYDMLVGHEVGHALWTPAKEWAEAIDSISAETGCSKEQAKSYLNIVEDARIERLIKNKFQGLKRDFYLAYEYFVAQEFFGKPSTFPTACFADRLNLHFKLGIHSNIVIPFSFTESQFIPLMERTQSFADVVEVVVKLIKFCKSQGQNHPVESQDDPQAEQQAGGEEEGEDGEGETSSKQTSDSEVSQKKAKPNQQQQSQELPTPSTNKMMENAIGKMVDPKASQLDSCYVCTLPPKHPNVIVTFDMIMKDVDLIIASKPNNLDLQKVLDPIKVKDYTDASRTMSQAFARKQAADLFHRSSVAKTGALDTLRMNSYRWSDDVFRRTVKIAKGKNHGIIILLDWSGSMQGIMRSTIGQLIILTDFCRRSGIPFEVFAFTDHTWTPNDFVNGQEELSKRVNKAYDKDNLKIHNIHLLNWLSSKMTNAQYEKGKSILWNWDEVNACAKHNQYSLSGTPTTSALVEIVETIEEFKAKNNLQSTHLIVLTDGDSCDGFYLPSDRTNADGSYRHRHGNIIISDPVTGLKYNTEQLDKSLTVQSTSVWIACDIIRKRTGTAVHWIKLHWSKGSPVLQIKGAKELPNGNWKRDGFVRCEVDGFDTAIIVDQNRIARQQNGEIGYSAQGMLETVTKNMNTAKSKTELQKAFIANQSAIGSLKSVATIIGETLGA